ncbi:C13 family peptidase [Phenylobacterium sp.]|uniref:C13 family peptidase n=1 Tax=Phenylobacterium sp. TaxID=1871053 RepID=UPI00286BE3DD|nr:C13 family peptidase [Phenylobacterium sp.]
MRRLARLAWLICALCLVGAAPAAADGAFSDWTAVIVAGDWHAHSGGPSEAFDNARRDVSLAFERAGFERANLREFSVRPDHYKNPNPEKSAPQAIYNALAELTARATGGCLVYFSSHGAPQGVVIDQQFLPPGVLARMLDTTCGKRPTVVIVSACFSGVFVPALAGANRMVLTAARPDRSSFGCGEADKYPYFDQCILESLPGATDFAVLGRTVQGCVATRETKEGMKPPSEPQLFIGPQLKPLLPLYSLAAPVPKQN